MIEDLYAMFSEAFAKLGDRFLQIIPDIIIAVIIFVIGWVVSIGIGKLVAGLLKRLKFNQLFDQGGMKVALERAEIKVSASDFIGAIFKWIFVAIFLLAAVDSDKFAELLLKVLGYVPNVIIAVLIFVVTVVIVDIVEKLVRVAVEGVRVGSGHIVSMIVKYSIWTYVTMAILSQLEITKNFMDTLFTGIVALLVISFGLAFGLGGKDVAAEILRDLKNKIKGE
ncbi:MAG: hypothetical protein ABH919_00695 [bacterium]